MSVMKDYAKKDYKKVRTSDLILPGDIIAAVVGIGMAGSVLGMILAYGLFCTGV